MNLEKVRLYVHNVKWLSIREIVIHFVDISSVLLALFRYLIFSLHFSLIH